MFKIGYPVRERVTACHFPASETIQDDSLTLREILTRFAGGQPLPQMQREGSFSPVEPDIDDDTYNIDLDDPFEVQNAIESIKNRQSNLEKQKLELQQRILSLDAEEPSLTPPPSPAPPAPPALNE